MTAVIKCFDNKETIFCGVKRRWLRPSKGRVCWYNAHLLKLSGLMTPDPIAFMEQRRGPIRFRSFYVYVFNDSPIAGEAYQSRSPSEREFAWFGDLYEKMRRMRLYHYDPSSSNFLLTDNGIMLIDVESMVDYSSKKRAFLFPYKYRKAKHKFLKVWKKQPQLLQRFVEAIETS